MAGAAAAGDVQNRRIGESLVGALVLQALSRDFGSSRCVDGRTTWTDGR